MPSEEPLAFRDMELALLARVVGIRRVVSVTGPPGIGKSALVEAFVGPRRRGKKDLATVVKLEGARTQLEAIHEIARALGISGTADAEAVAARIGRVLGARKGARIVLDGVDRCRAPVAKLVTRWRAEWPETVFVLTARAKIGIPAEHRVELGPLDVPGARERDADAINRSAAVQLFVRRAAEVRPGFRLDADNARVVATIVRRLEGIPLAIELCASRMVALSEKDIAELLSERLDLLDDEARSLRSAFALSWDELAPDDASLLAACSSFRGGFTLDAAAALDAARDGKGRVRVARALERLVDASLVRIDEDRRYGLLGTLEEFAAEKLAARGATTVHEERHARYYAGLRAKTLSLDALATERKNFEAAFDRSLRLGIDGGAGALLAYAPVALARGPLAPFVERTTRALERLRLDAREHAELLYWRGLARVFQGQRDDGAKDLERARTAARATGDRRIEALAASKTALVLGLKGEVDAALAVFEEARVAATASRDDLTRGIVGKDRANVLSEAGRNDDAVVELGRSHGFLRAAGDRREEAFVLMMLGMRFGDDGRLAEARRDLAAALELFRVVGDRRTEAWATAMMAVAIAEEGRHSEARTLLSTGIALIRDVGDEQTEGLLLGYLGNVALEQGILPDAERAYRDAIVLLARSRDRASEGYFTATAAVVEHALGRTPSARDGFVRARRLLERDGRPARRTAVAILATVLGDEAPAATGEHEEVRFARRVVAGLARRPQVGSSVVRRELVVASDGSWVRIPEGEVTRLGADRPIARIARRLALERVRHPGRPVPALALVRAGWPDERMLPAAAKNRLHVTIARLRRLLPGAGLLHEDDGYLLDPKRPARLADANESSGRQA